MRLFIAPSRLLASITLATVTAAAASPYHSIQARWVNGTRSHNETCAKNGTTIALTKPKVFIIDMVSICHHTARPSAQPIAVSSGRRSLVWHSRVQSPGSQHHGTWPFTTLPRCPLYRQWRGMPNCDRRERSVTIGPSAANDWLT